MHAGVLTTRTRDLCLNQAPQEIRQGQTYNGLLIQEQLQNNEAASRNTTQMNQFGKTNQSYSEISSKGNKMNQCLRIDCQTTKQEREHTGDWVDGGFETLKLGKQSE